MDPLNQNSGNSVLAEPASDEVPNDGTGVVKLDPWLEPFKDALRSRYSKAQSWIKTINDTEGGLEKFSRVSKTLSHSCHQDVDWKARATRPTVSSSRAMETSHTESGRRMLYEHT
ncbi:alpha-1,4-glucan branching enzyme [Elasticomyces elasticus]|nr:alpha-1,4-glucan branching enzyme [Elasticomyces elasticus]KAK4990752.1 alpha-1,4-glucan branching enzyme [Elasticomyces elasticus]